MSGELVRLNVYSADGKSSMAYHSGVEVYGTEYCFAGGNSGGSGVTLQRPRAAPPGGSWVFYQTVEIAPLQKTREEVQRLVSEIRAEFTAGSYDLVSRNCNHFSEAFCQKLCGKGLPVWVNALAGLGNALGVGGLIRGAMGQGAVGGGKADVGAGGLASTGLMSASIGADGDLSGEVDWGSVGVLNSADGDAASALQAGKAVWSEADSSAELLLFLPLRTQVKLQALQLSAPSAAEAPQHARLFKNERNLDMADAAGGVAPTQDYAAIPWRASPGDADGTVTAALEVNFLKFQGLGFLAVHLCRDDEDGVPDEEGPPICVKSLRLIGKT